MHGLYLMTAHSKMLQNTRLIKGKSPSSCVRIYPQGSEQRALYLDQKTNMKSSPPPCADDILWVVILIFDVYALFFLSHFDSVPAKIQPWGKKKKKAKNFKALNAERMSVSSRKGNCAHVPYRELVFQPHGLRSQAHWPWETRAVCGCSSQHWALLIHCQHKFYAQVDTSHRKITHCNYVFLFVPRFIQFKKNV